MLEHRFPGIAIEAVALTFGTCICMLLAYRSGMIQATRQFTIGVIAATGGIALVYVASMVLGLFHVQVREFSATDLSGFCSVSWWSRWRPLI